MNRTALFSIILALDLLALNPSWAQSLPLPNPSFEAGGEQTIAHWTLENGPGRPTTQDPGDGQRSALVQGDPDATSYWRSEPLPFEPRTLYAMRYLVKRTGEGGGPPVAGPVFSNYVLYTTDLNQWNDFTLIFQTPDDLTPDRAWLRFGQARMSTASTVAFDGVQVYPVQPVHVRQGQLELGDGETLAGNRYISAPMWNTLRSNQYRSLYSYRNTVYNYNAFLMGDGSEVVLRYQVGDRNQLSATLALQPMYYFDGRMIVEASADGENWREIHRFEERKGIQIELPEDLFPAPVIWIRIRCEAESPVGIDFELGSVGLSTFKYEAEVDGEPVNLRGSTRYVQILDQDPRFSPTIISTGDMIPGGDNTFVVRLENPSTRTLSAGFSLRVEHAGQVVDWVRRQVDLAPGQVNRVELPYEIDTYGEHLFTIRAEKGLTYGAQFETYVSPLYASGYGEQLPGSSDAVGLWWASSGWKIGRDTPIPQPTGEAVRIRLARNETEAAQLVVRPTQDLEELMVEAGQLEGPAGASIPTDAVDLLRVRYVDVIQASDRLGAVASWPEPLPPFDRPVEVEAGQNQPLWIRVKTPKDIPAGIYRGAVTLSARNYKNSVPLEVEVYDFTLPDEVSVESAFGLSDGVMKQYHRLKDDEQLRQVWEKYLAALAAYRIGPYNPAPFDPIDVQWPEDADQSTTMSAHIDAEAWVTEMRRVMDKHHFKTFRFAIPGLSGSKYPNHRREIAGFQGGTPEFQQLFDSYAGQVQTILRKNGWLDNAFVYWFDEPGEHDIPFVQSGFDLLRNAAPDIRRMIAVNSASHLEPLEGYVNLWCPQLNAVPIPFLERRREAGDRFWWYLCTSPKEPYPGLFIDHPGINMRTWLWMTWGYDVEGILVWATNRWHSRAAYPDSLQNPYEDPMTWQGDAGPGVRNPYGNGDGVFLYPPESIFDGDSNEPVLDGPVGSQRGEMLRDGIEDYEYFVILRRLLEQKGDTLSDDERKAIEKLLVPPEEVYVDRRHYSFDPAPLERHRDRLARAIMMLNDL